MAHISINAILALLIFISTAHAQFQFFEQMFGAGGQQRESQDQRNVPSDSAWYQKTYDGVEEKFELGEGSAICISRGGFKAGEAARKVELARKGLL
ncbi:hypothetical protein CPC735_030990 [Coccidioides posadasii C735 delta SOWgp]|uniref:Long chronological lifespan protein 2 n=1 Tax=Coccidioides posadasii (strain C735) TaxID=222929 RepID=C5P4X3_COCP7|nr:hypothetical protein CPC735_030990 [Coccidioides posadasii C735 delta SOWgp]EER27763.1 hypothetical protein CPC735_030990 [Coccidioides posadasii C735 delta SOWgp]|eukprot:XP_003069908.1 hypothetical protein CPC735_030990 [Coccidioides posadasii C735 delta SOWgp]